MADTINDSLVKVTGELKEANQRSLEASKELGKLTASAKSGASSIGSAVKDAVGLDKLESTIMSLPGMNIAKAIKDQIFKKKARIKEEKNLAKRLGITREQLIFQVQEQELLQARENESKILIDAAEKLGFNTDRIAKVNEEGNAELNGTLRESNGQFVSRADASADANLAALKDFSSTQENSQEKAEPKTRKEDFTPVEEMTLDQSTLEKLATENTLLSIADNILSAINPPNVGPSGASASEDAGEARRAADASLTATETTNKLLGSMGHGDKDDDESKGGFFIGLASMRLALAGLVPAITAFVGFLTPLALPIIAVVAGITAAIGFITGFMEGFAVGGIFGGLKEGLMKLFDWFIGLPLKILKDITVWALGALGMDGLADALDAFPLVESVRKIFSFLTDLIVVPLGFVMVTIGGLFGGLFEIVMAPIRALSTAIMSVFDGFSDIFSGIKMIFQGDILGGFNSMFSGIKTLIMAPINFVVDTVKGIFGGIFDMLMAPFNALLGAIGFIFGPQSALGGVVEWFSETLGGIWETITAPFTNVMAFLSDLFSFPTSFGDGLMKLIDIIYYPINLAVNFVKDLFGFGDPDVPFSLSQFLLDTVTGIFDWFKGLFNINIGALVKSIPGAGRILSFFGYGDEESPDVEPVTSTTLPQENIAAVAGDMKDSAVSVISGEKVDTRSAIDSARDSGLYNKNIVGKSKVDQSKIAEASDLQLQAILDDNDISRKNKKIIEKELAARKINTELKVETNEVESDALKVKVFGKEYTKEELIQARKDGTVKRSIATSKIRELDMMEKREQMNEADVTSGTFVQGKLVTPPESTHKMTDGSMMKDSDMKGSSSPLGMGSESITNSVVNSAATANATTSNLTYIPSKLDTTNNISSNSVSTNDMPAGAVMQADTVVLNTQRTVALREQGLDTQQAVAMAPMIMQTSQNNIVNNNVSSSKPIMIPVPVSNQNDSGFNFSNG